MLRRSTADQYTHFLGDVISNVESSHGVVLSGRSTGGVVEPFGDDTNIGLTLRAKGAGPLTLGSSGSVILMAGSTSPSGGMLRFPLFNSSTPSFSSGSIGGGVATLEFSTVTLTGVNSSHYILFNARNLSTTVAYSHADAGSTDNEVRLWFHRASPSSLAISASTFSANILVFRF